MSHNPFGKTLYRGENTSLTFSCPILIKEEIIYHNLFSASGSLFHDELSLARPFFFLSKVKKNDDDDDGK